MKKLTILLLIPLFFVPTNFAFGGLTSVNPCSVGTSCIRPSIKCADCSPKEVIVPNNLEVQRDTEPSEEIKDLQRQVEYLTRLLNSLMLQVK